MKKVILLAALMLAAPFSYAQVAKGVIEEVRVCGSGDYSGTGWARNMQFKVDGKWFAIYADYSGSHSGRFEYDDNLTTSLVMMAYSQQAVIEVKATYPWSSSLAACGTSDSGNALYHNLGDYVRLSNKF